MYESRGIENKTETYEVHSLVFMIHNEVETVFLRLILFETISKLWHPLRKFMDINIQPYLDLEETILLLKKLSNLTFLASKNLTTPKAYELFTFFKIYFF